MMQQDILIRRTYKYPLYQCSRKDQALHDSINIAGIMWNHALALRKRYYRLTQKHLSYSQLDKHFAKLRMRRKKFAYWKLVGSQTVQDVLLRQEDAFERFFKKQAGFPRFKKVKRYKSITLTQAGWKLFPDKRPVQDKKRGVGVIRIGKQTYKFIKHRELQGEIKTLIIKRDRVGHLWVCFSVIEVYAVPERVSTGESGGFDFGLKTFLTDQHGQTYLHPEFFKQQLKHLQHLSRALSRKQAGSGNQHRAQQALARAHQRITDKRRDFHFKLAHTLCKQCDTLIFEDLNLAPMKKRWGRKASDLGFGKFLDIATHVAGKQMVQIHQIDRFERTTALCCRCEHRQALPLRERTFRCQACGLILDRDWNAAVNIWYAGASACGLGVVRPSFEGNPATA